MKITEMTSDQGNGPPASYGSHATSSSSASSSSSYFRTGMQEKITPRNSQLRAPSSSASSVFRQKLTARKSMRGSRHIGGFRRTSSNSLRLNRQTGTSTSGSSKRANLPASRQGGGQRKRTAAASSLLSSPSSAPMKRTCRKEYPVKGIKARDGNKYLVEYFLEAKNQQ